VSEGGRIRGRVTWRDQALKNFGVWLAVYPAVLISSYLFSWLAPGVPLWLEILISTAFTVPLISYVAVPWVERRLAHAKGESAAQLKREEAEMAEGGHDA
jgi:antibiotic biosynthesis monooxygenase (ABM) superfamily enzyme